MLRVKCTGRKSWIAISPLVAPLTAHLHLHKCSYVSVATCECCTCWLVCSQSAAALMLCDPCGCRWPILASFACIWAYVIACDPEHSWDVAMYSVSSLAQAIHTSSLQWKYPTVICESAHLGNQLYLQSKLHSMSLKLCLWGPLELKVTLTITNLVMDYCILQFI